MIAIRCYSKTNDQLMNLFDELTWRGLVYDATDGLARRVRAASASPPTSASIRPRRACTSATCCRLMALARLQRFGHSPIAIVGGGTGHDRRSERQVAGAHAAVARADRRERRRHQAAARAVSRLRSRATIRRASSTTPTGWRRSICCGFCATPASTSPSTTCCRRSR